VDNGAAFFILFALVAVAILIIATVFDRKRTEALGAIATDLGFSFYEKGNDQLMGVVQDFRLFGRGRSRRIRRLMQGQVGDAFVSLFDYQYTTGGGKNSHTYVQTVLLVQSEALQLPQFFLAPEDIFHKIAEMFGAKDIDFDSHPQFSKQYLLKGEDETAIRRIFGFRTLEFYESVFPLTTEARDSRLLVYRPSHTAAPNQLKSFLDQGCQVFEQFKSRF
jgi:hypothetical protein